MGSAASFAEHRPRLLRLAQRMLGSMHEAEDVLQDAFVRWHESAADAVRVPEAFLVTVVTRLALDRLRRKKTEREAYVGQWLPEPWMVGAQLSDSPELQEERASELSYAAQVLLSRLNAEERAAFLLRDIFDLEYSEVAGTLERSEAATRKLVQRAHEHLAEHGPRHEASLAEQRDLLARFKAACDVVDADALSALLAPDATYTTDGGGKVFAGRDVLVGAPRIVRVTVTVAKKTAAQIERRLLDIDGEPALATLHDGRLHGLIFIAVERGVIRDVYNILNPDKLRALAALWAQV
jgi:RNA polymerase sigma-70 factor (ECF subfamily)